ncbi:MAG: hypothetical protein ACJ73J_00465 [Actinomycetes bacterium]
MSRRVPLIAGSTIALTVAASAPVLLAPTAAVAGHKVARDSFERSLAGWKKAPPSTRLDRVSAGRGQGSQAARLRPPATRAANVGMTDAPALVRRSHRGARYVATAWVKATPDAHRGKALQVRVSLGEQKAKGLGVHAWRGARLSTSHWRKVTVPFTARHKGRHLDLTVRARHISRGGALLVDDVRIQKRMAPHPSNRKLRGVHYGASVDEGRLDWMRALHRSDHRYSRMEVVRFFEPFIRDSWSGTLGNVRRPVNVSFYARPGAVLAGAYDLTLRRWFRDAPNHTPIWWTYWHEPEDDIANGNLSAKHYRQAWRHINAIARQAGTPNLHPTLVLMAWTGQPASGRRISDYYPGHFIDVIGWDGYNPPRARGYASPRAMFAACAAKNRRLDARFAIPELGGVLVPGDDGSRRASWLVQVAKYAAARNAAFVTYWDAKIPNENYQLRDLPSRSAWHHVVKD